MNLVLNIHTLFLRLEQLKKTSNGKVLYIVKVQLKRNAIYTLLHPFKNEKRMQSIHICSVHHCHYSNITC